MPASFAMPARNANPAVGACSPSLGTSPGVFRPPDPPLVGRANIPLHHATTSNFVATSDLDFAIPILISCIDICVVMVSLYITSMEASASHYAQRKKLRRGVEGDADGSTTCALRKCEPEEDAPADPHCRQIIDLLAWQADVLSSRWYVKPRSTCWFEEYLFNIYTPDMFYDILRMSRRTFDRLVHDLRPFIAGQHTHWRQPIGVEKKVVVTLFKLMHGVSMPLVVDKAALGKSTVSKILRQVCGAISTNFGHLIAWPVGRRLARIAAGF